MLKIPKLVYDDVSPAAFQAECRKMLPASEPKFGIGDIVLMPQIFGRIVPAMVAGFEKRQGDEWHYHLIRPRDYDGGLERVVAREKDLKSA